MMEDIRSSSDGSQCGQVVRSRISPANPFISPSPVETPLLRLRIDTVTA